MESLIPGLLASSGALLAVAGVLLMVDFGATLMCDDKNPLGLNAYMTTLAISGAALFATAILVVQCLPFPQ